MEILHFWSATLQETRQSSCATARGVPPAPPASKSFQNFCPNFCPHLGGTPPPSSEGIPLGAPPSSWFGVPPGMPTDPDPDLDQGPPGLDLGGPQTLTRTLTWGPPRHWPRPWPGGPCELTNWKHYLPVILRMRAVMIGHAHIPRSVVFSNWILMCTCKGLASRISHWKSIPICEKFNLNYCVN